MPPKNIVYLHAHDAGRWIQPYGYNVSTPNLQKFAEQGVTFRQAFATAPTCGPSRSSLLSGQYPHQIDMYGLPGSQGWEFPDYNQHLARHLQNNGYLTALAGCQHECDGNDLSPLNYDRILNDPNRPEEGQFYPDTLCYVDKFLAEQSQNKGKPFFLSVGIDEPHRNNIGRPELGIGSESALFSKTRYYDPEKLDSRYLSPPPYLPDTPATRQDTASLHEGVRLMDEYMGHVLYSLSQYGFDDNTLVIVTTDHGIEFPGGKKTLSDQGLGVMLMLRDPETYKGGKVVDALVSQLDLYPTVMEAAGIEKPDWLEGTSLSNLTSGKTNSEHRELYGEQTYHGSLEALRCIRTERYKLVLRHDSQGPLMPHDGPSYEIMRDYGYYKRDLGKVELFDLYLDPLEAYNRAEDPAYLEIREKLTKRIYAWMEQTNDPFPSGEFPKPK
ncbi:sulfatase family protein [Pelagicoccus albus]|uniref:Sulfatase n=1 Tax=Pelagicoccus albus TaxID=415222 RepID=A0A7X1B7G5_9BACT|nr:sulfatase [Pelagicoccus albus]MBC2607076.1 sulfatase [Pelagicoccus albus]